MTRDELLLDTLAKGESSTAALALATGLGERTCRYGLRRLAEEGYVWSPARGLYRLTAVGRTIAGELVQPSPPATSEPPGSAPGEQSSRPRPWLVRRRH
jgi:hypothetical protein